ncbi:flavodoxin family protein [Methylovirgula sp. 4M-Z18]|uniref:flavodoxin family protein n=1 Tax=Methylovirgula sp. 4M-Z18 TaxID=2293567 RepID=UPI000E2F8E92|nr:flavodoxin family protein [Methylovirgula sp. 4M-Z18]RFB80506.1 flavodoxin family protein [Methylovirgula sp. 4M-Z18]
MTSVSIVYHSGYGHTAKAAAAVEAGAASVDGVKVQLIVIDAEGNLPEGGWETLATSNAIVLGSPTYMAGPSWQFKKFADASSKVWFGQGWKNKIFAGFTNSASMSGDKLGTIDYLFHLAQQHAGIWVGTGMMPASTKAATEADVNHLGSFSGLMTRSPADASAEEAPGAGHIETAKLFGARVAEITARFAK